MKVHELIEILNEYPRDCKVIVLCIDDKAYRADAYYDDIDYHAEDKEIFIGRVC